jgi:hypothetical protein
VNLLERIDKRLADKRARIHPLDFEDCATSLLSVLHPSLVAITGGTDYGLDAEITTDDKTVGVVITSSREWASARRSLRESLRSMRKNDLPVNRVVAANLVEVNRQKREKLRLIAEEFDCELVQVYDLVWFANQFRENPDWRKKILQIEGGPFSFSREPRGARPGERQLPTVGRDDLIAQASEAAVDVILFGVPGAGKSHVASKLDGALFLERRPTPERLLDDLISTQPELVVVDDAGARLEELDLLLQVRKAEGFKFRVAGTCWPHERHDIADHLPDAAQFEVDLLTREELGSLLRERGITRLSVIVHLLEQAQGRPAWALNLADLLIRDGDWRSVWTGKALREQIFAFLRRSKAPQDAIDVLGTIALLGEISEGQASKVAQLLEMPKRELERLIRSVAIAGLVDLQRVDVRDPETDEVERENTYRVQPRIIAASLVSEVYFAGQATPARLRDLKAALPELAVDIVQTQIYAKLLGAAEPVVPTTTELLAVLPSAYEAGKASELLRSFGQLGPEQAKLVVDLQLARVNAACKSGNASLSAKEAASLAARVAEALEDGNTHPVAAFLAVLEHFTSRGWDIQTTSNALVEAVRDARSGDTPTATDLIKLANAVSVEPQSRPSNPVWVSLARAILEPTFDGNYMNPEVVRQMVLQSFTWAASDMDTLFDAMHPELARRAPDLAASELLTLVDLLDKWIRIARGYSLPFGGQTSPEQEQSGERIAHALATAIAAAITTPGVRAEFNKVAKSTGVSVAEPDPLFAALTLDREPGRDWQEARRRKEAELDSALAAYQQQPPDVLMQWLERNEAELATVRPGTSGAWQVLSRIAYQRDLQPDMWLQAALEHGLAGSATSLIENCARNDSLTTTLMTQLLDDPVGRSAVVSAVIGVSTNPELVATLVAQLTQDDIQQLDSTYVLKQAPASTRHKLFTHPDPDVRGTAAAVWAAECSYDSEGMPPDPYWTTAISDLTIPVDSVRGHMQGQALKMLAAASPATYADLLVRHANAVPGQNGYTDFDEWEESASGLAPDDRRKLWIRVRDTEMAHELFWVIAGNDSEWVAEAVRDPGFAIPLRRLLHAFRFQFSTRFSLSTLADIMKPLNWEPEDLLWTLEVGTHTGEEHERYARYLNICRDLATSEDPALARLGTRGVEIYEPRLAEAKAEARRAAVRGTHGF